MSFDQQLYTCEKNIWGLSTLARAGLDFLVKLTVTIDHMIL